MNGVGNDPRLHAAGGEGCEYEVHACLPKIPLGVSYHYVCGPNNVLQQRSIDLSPVCTAKDVYDCLNSIKGAGEAARRSGQPPGGSVRNHRGDSDLRRG